VPYAESAQDAVSFFFAQLALRRQPLTLLQNRYLPFWFFSSYPFLLQLRLSCSSFADEKEKKR
jgi:hypothetical protein